MEKQNNQSLKLYFRGLSNKYQQTTINRNKNTLKLQEILSPIKVSVTNNKSKKARF